MPRLEKDIVVKNKQGLHARPAALFVQTAEKYDSKVTVIKDSEQVNGKSIMGILMLGAHYQSALKLIVEGEDAAEALQELTTFLEREEFDS